jgi:hypothetical protein
MQASAPLPNISSMTPTLSAKSLLSFNLTGASRSQQDQSILLMERSSRSQPYHPFREPVALHGVAFPIKSSMDVIRVPIDSYIFTTLSEAKMTNFPITPLRSAIRLAPAWAKQPVNATPSSSRISALPPLHFRYQQTSPRNAISVPVRALPGSP